MRSTDKNRAWENVKLSKIAKDIADGANLTLFYDTQEDPEIKRAEQKEKSNLVREFAILLRVLTNGVRDYKKKEGLMPLLHL